MATFWEMSDTLVYHLFSLYLVYLLFKIFTFFYSNAVFSVCCFQFLDSLFQKDTESFRNIVSI